MPPTHRGIAAAAAAAASTGSIGGEASVSVGVLTVHCDNSLTASTGSIEDHPLHKKHAAASIGVVHRGKAAATGSIGGDMLQKKAAAVLIGGGGVPTVGRGKAAATTGSSIGSTSEMLQQKKAAAVSPRGLPPAHPRKGPAAVVTGSSGKMSASGYSTGGMPPAHPRKGPAVVTGSSQKKATATRGGSPHGGKEAPSRLRCGGTVQGLATAALKDVGPSTRLPAARERKHKNSGSRMCTRDELRATIAAPAFGSLTNVLNEIDPTVPPLGLLDGKEGAPRHHPEEKTPKGLKEKADAASRRVSLQQKRHAKVKSDTALGGQMLHKCCAQEEVHTSASKDIYSGSTTAKDRKTSAANHRSMKACSVSSAKMPQKKMHKVDKAKMGLSGREMQRKDPAKEVDTSTEENVGLQEAKLLIRQLNELGRGEHISNEEFLQYYNRLPNPPPWIDTDVKLKYGKLTEQDILHARYRFRYCKYKLSQKVSKKEPHGDTLEEDYLLYHDRGLKEDDLQDISEQDCSVKFLREQGYFKHFEEDGTLDWFFHHSYLDCDLLNDYQRLVLRNYGGTEYARWSEYHNYLHSYRIEKEYVEYCEKLSKQLEWMEDYLRFDRPSYKWDYVSSRGALQAIKIAATGFSEISATLAYNGYYECIESMSYNITWFKELDGVYFEIWLRVTQGLSFKDALVEVYHLNRFPLRQNMMKHALDFDASREEMEEQYRTCTADITSKVKYDQAQKLIGEAVKKLYNKPKSYEQYIRKKIDIASVVGIPLEIETVKHYED